MVNVTSQPEGRVMKSIPFSRRTFAKGLALTPLGLASSSAIFAQAAASTQQAQETTPQPPKRVPKTAAEYNRHPPIHETEPFAEPLTFSFRRANLRLRPFALNEVALAAGPLQQARDWNRGYMLRLPNDRLLHNFRVTAGLPSKAEPLGGWEAPSAELRGHFVGHYLSACAMLYAATRDSEIKIKADGLITGISECQKALNANGYVSAFPEELFDRLDKREKVWAPFYTLHKIMAGLLDMKQYGDNDQALDILLQLAAWVDTWTAARAEEHMQDILKTEFGGMSEVLYNLSGLTGNARWAGIGDRFVKKVFCTPLAKRRDELKGLHCNTHIPQVIGAARRYELSSDYRFADVSTFFFETVSEARTYATGGSGNTEGWLTDAHRLSLEIKASSHHQECCCAYNMMKLARHLYQWSADARFIDYYERNLLNHRLGAIAPETGLTTYFLSMSPGAWKTTCTEDQTFWCCTGSALEEYSKLNDTIYFHDEESVYVNLYVASRLDWHERGIALQQETQFPESDRTLLTVRDTTSRPWTLKLRIPAWTSADNIVTINRRKLDAPGVPGSYLGITRTWRPGDRVELTMPMRLTVEPLRDDPGQLAFLYGPLVLAGQFGDAPPNFDLLHNQGPEIQEAPPIRVPTLSSRGKPPEALLEPVPGLPLAFQAKDQSETFSLIPLNKSWGRFTVYWTVT
jgi:hypothetical protein